MIRNTSFAVTTKLIGAAVLGACAFAAPAHAATIDFEGFGGAVEGATGIQTKGYSVGFFDANLADGGAGFLVGNFYDGTDTTACIDMSCAINNKTTYYGALNDSYLEVVNLNPAVRFQVKGFDASFLGGSASLTAFPAVSGLLRIQGYLSNGTSLTETYQLAGPSAAGFNFGRFATSASFGSQLFTAVDIFGFACAASGSCSAFSTDRAQFGLDNLVLVEVPEPASMALFGLGLAGLTVAARRRKA